MVADANRFIARINPFTGRLTVVDTVGLAWIQVATRYYTCGYYGIYFGLEDKRFVVMRKGEKLEETDTFAHACDIVFNDYIRGL